MSFMLRNWAKQYSNLTDAEKALEPAVARLGVPYRVQNPHWAIHAITDFILLQQRVVFEVDDPSHQKAAKKKADAERTKKLEAAGWRVARCKNEEALRDPRGTVARMLRELGLEILIPAPEGPQKE